MISRRHVFLIIGYSPIAAETQNAWFKRSFERFAQTWNVSGTVSDPVWTADKSEARWTADTRGPNWRVETTYEPLTWDDIIHADMTQPLRSQIFKSVWSFFDLLFTGTIFRYFWANWTYGLFFLLPYAQVAFYGLVAYAAGDLAARFLDFSGGPRIALSLIVGVTAFIALFYWPGRRWHTQHLLVDWIFSWEFARNRRPDMNARLDRFADILVARAKENSSDEIILAGHCLGAGLAAVALARALERDPDLGRHGPAINLMTIGATLPKFALHPAGEHVRRAALRIASEPTITWAEYQSRDDAISFYKFDPVTLVRLARRSNDKPIVRRLWLSDLVEDRTWKRIRFRFLRRHLQFFLANEKRALYDYFMFVCGPVAFRDLIRAKRGPIDFIADDGSLKEPPAQRASGGATDTVPATPVPQAIGAGRSR